MKKKKRKKKDLDLMLVKKIAKFCDMKIVINDKWQCSNWLLLWTDENMNFWDLIDISTELLNTFDIFSY